MNYKYGNAIILGLFLATLSMSKVASAALIKYEIAAFTENYGSNHWDVSFSGSVIIDSTTADSDGFYKVDESGFSDYSLKYWYDGDDFSNSSTLGFPQQVDLTFGLSVIFNTDVSWSYARFSANGATDDVKSVFDIDVLVGCTAQELRLKGSAYCSGYESFSAKHVVGGDLGVRGITWTVREENLGVVRGPVGLVPEPYTVSIFILGIIGLATRRFIKQS